MHYIFTALVLYRAVYFELTGRLACCIAVTKWHSNTLPVVLMCSEGGGGLPLSRCCGHILFEGHSSVNVTCYG